MPCVQGDYTLKAYAALRSLELDVNVRLFGNNGVGDQDRAFFIYEPEYIYWCGADGPLAC